MRTHVLRAVAIITSAMFFISACATTPPIQPIVFQGPEFDSLKYQGDLADCHRIVEDQTSGIANGTDVTAKTIGGAALGAVAGVVLGSAFGSAGLGVAIGTAAGGVASGLGAYEGSETEKRTIFHQAITSCLTLKGYQVLGLLWTTPFIHWLLH
jgi:hypothetical protein